jgi:aldose 1-epimerase
MNDTLILRLRHGDSALEVCPSLGGTILRYTWSGIPILRPSIGVPSMPRLTACYPLLPFSNRIAGGRLAFGGENHAIPRTVDYAPLPMHGLAWQRPWRVDIHGDDHAVLKQDYAPEGPLPAWPFPYVAEQTFLLDEQGLHMTLSLRNTGSRAQPAGLGWHPYFPRTPETRVWADVGEMWVSDAANLPVRLEPAAPALATTGLAVANTDYDNVFRGFQGRARVAWPERSAAVTLRADPAMSHLVIFTPPGKPHLAVEPVTHMTDAFNRYAAAGGSADPKVDPGTGTVVLAAGATLKVAMSLLPTRLEEAGSY